MLQTQLDPLCASVPHFSTRVFILSTVLVLHCASFSHSTSLFPNCNLRKIMSKCSVPFLSSYPLFYGWQTTERKGPERKRPCLGWRQCHRTVWRHQKEADKILWRWLADTTRLQVMPDAWYNDLLHCLNWRIIHRPAAVQTNSST